MTVPSNPDGRACGGSGRKRRRPGRRVRVRNDCRHENRACRAGVRLQACARGGEPKAEAQARSPQAWLSEGSGQERVQVLLT